MSGAWSPSFSVKIHARTLNLSLSLRLIAWRSLLLCQFKTEPTPPRRQRRGRHHLRMFRRATKMLQRTKSRQSPRRRKNLHGGTAAQCHSKIQKMKEGYSLKLLTFLAMGR
jgi:hypothetical protein